MGEWVLLAPGGGRPGLLLNTHSAGCPTPESDLVPSVSSAQAEEPCVNRLAFLEFFHIYLVLVEIS